MEYIFLALLIISVSVISIVFYRKMKNNDMLLSIEEEKVTEEEEVTLEESIPTPIKEEIPEERKKLFTGVWDSERLLRELLEVTDFVKGSRIYLNLNRTSSQIRCKRIISVISALKGSISSMEIKNNSILLRNLISENCSEERISELIPLILEILPEMNEKYREEFFNLLRDFVTRIHIFSILFRYRQETFKLSTYWNNVGATNRVEDMAIAMTKELYKEKMKGINNTLDKLLLLSLGDGFDKTITERELLEKYDYPNVTDEELKDKELAPWEIRIKFEESDESK